MKKRHFVFEWFKKGYNPVTRHNTVTVTKGTIDNAMAVKQAINLFERGFGNLRKNQVLSIQEIDADGNPIGELITPSDEI